jgi:GNAT superfamily N-acetyltransferase
LGVARFVRLRDRPTTAEAAVTVVDDAQGRGIGTLLLDVLAAGAHQVGVEWFTALMLSRNDEMRDLLERLGRTRAVDQQAGTVQIDVELPPSGLSDDLRAILRASRRARECGQDSSGRSPEALNADASGAPDPADG